MAIYIKINDTLYPAAISGKFSDPAWNNRSSKTIRLAMTPASAAALFVDDLEWSIVEEIEIENEPTVTNEYDNSEYCIAGDITDHRDGTVSVKMGKITADELLEIISGASS